VTLAITADGTRAYVACESGTGAEVAVVDTASGAVLTRIPVLQPNLVDILISPDGGRLYVSWRSDQNSGVVVVDTSTNQLIATLPTRLRTLAGTTFRWW
jgi:YVTN family beta-propeller protein